MNWQFGLQNSQEVFEQRMIHNDSLYWLGVIWYFS